MTLQQAEHVSARLADSSHLGDDRQVMDDESDFVLLHSREVRRVAQQTESRDVRRTVRVVFVHQACSFIQRYQFPSHVGTKRGGTSTFFESTSWRSRKCCFAHNTKLRTHSVETGHAEHGALISLPDIVLADDQLDAVPALRLIQPLIRVHGHLCPQRFCQHQHISHHCVVRPAET